MTRQRLFQIRQKAKGLCMKCSAPLFNATVCAKHAAKDRKRIAKANGYKAKYNCASRMAEKELAD